MRTYRFIMDIDIEDDAVLPTSADFASLEKDCKGARFVSFQEQPVFEKIPQTQVFYPEGVDAFQPMEKPE